MLMLVVLVLFLFIVASLIWGRLFFFKLNSGTPKLAALLYDFAVAIQLVATVYFLIYDQGLPNSALIACALCYTASLAIFWSSVRRAKSLDFAFSDNVGDIVTTGTFGIFRHPFYVSYMLVWSASTVVFGSLYHWVTLIYLLVFYVCSARKEERLILQSPQGESYKLYQQRVGMFIPRMKKWKQ
jgi:protein-S-isoprenylcysteine O-methyltransferase Ste14